MVVKNFWDIVVVGGGHAGIEAAHAGARLGCSVLLISMDAAAIGRMSCNPAIGGVAKGQIVRDIDALGGVMGTLADRAGIHFRMLNLSKGPAVHGPRAQQDMDLYSRLAREEMEKIAGLEILEALVESFVPTDAGFVLQTKAGDELRCAKLVFTTGTFLGGLLHTGLKHVSGGRVGEPAAETLSESFHKLGIRLRRLKTGTPARLERKSMDLSRVEEQPGDDYPMPFSFRTKKMPKNKDVCWITRTSARTHEILRAGFDRSPLFSGKIQGVGPRYCPSIEDKVFRFPERDSHQLFIEPEGLENGRIYINGFSSSLPEDVQDEALRTLPGLEHCKVIRYGYAVEYDAIYATELKLSLEHRKIPGLYFAGQVNGTSGYEEAAAQGLLAGLNAARKIRGEDLFLLGRSESYIGVMIDDLVHVKLDEPYRMFTSRAEYRLFLRSDNAEERLLERGRKAGLVNDETWQNFLESRCRREKASVFLDSCKLKKELLNPWLKKRKETPVRQTVTAGSLVNRVGVDLTELLEFCEYEADLSLSEKLQLRADRLYAGYYARQEKEIARHKRLEKTRIPQNFYWKRAVTLSTEARQKLSEYRPLTVGDAARVPGVRPADISVLLLYLEKGLPKQA